MDIIYKPKGRAREFAGLALNYYLWCEHGCLYCFGPCALMKKRNSYYSSPALKKNVIERVKKDACELQGNDHDEILLSFIGDPYQPCEMKIGITRHVIEIFVENELSFTVLTKGGSRAERDFDLLNNYPRARFGTTLVFTEQKDADYWEPGAATVEDRIKAIEKAHSIGIKTWVSIEPVIKSDQSLELIRRLHPVVDHWKVGKINYNKAVEDRVNWIEFREEVKELLESISASYYLKKSLTEL